MFVSFKLILYKVRKLKIYLKLVSLKLSLFKVGKLKNKLLDVCKL